MQLIRSTCMQSTLDPQHPQSLHSHSTSPRPPNSPPSLPRTKPSLDRNLAHYKAMVYARAIINAKTNWD